MSVTYMFVTWLYRQSSVFTKMTITWIPIDHCRVVFEYNASLCIRPITQDSVTA